MPQGKPPARTGITKLAHAMSHPERVRILMGMNSPIRRLSPSEYASECGLVLSDASYHFRVLEKAGCLELVDEKRRRGAIEHYYEPIRRALAWTREWERLPAVVKQNIAAVSLLGYVESVGRAVDAGMYDKRDESHISNDNFWTDALGFTEASMVMDRCLKELMDIATAARERLKQNPDTDKFLASHGMSLFETAPKVPLEDD